jgi:hypothetical protein
VVAALGLIGAVAADGALRVLSVLVLLLGLAVAIVAWVARRSALWAIRRFAEPADVAEHRAAFDAAIERAALPTGPIAIVRFLFRLRRGAGAEVARLHDVVRDLVATVRATEPDPRGGGGPAT